MPEDERGEACGTLTSELRMDARTLVTKADEDLDAVRGAVTGYVAALAGNHRSAHLLSSAGRALCGWEPLAGHGWIPRPDPRSTCFACRSLAAMAGQLPGQSPEPGAFPVVVIDGRRYRVAECACCGQQRPVLCRGLCPACGWKHQKAGTLDQFGYTRRDKLADFGALRDHAVSIRDSASRIGISERTAQRYEQARRRATETAA
jgi:hypothetical protein